MQRDLLIVSIHGGPSGVESEQFIGDMWFGSYSPAVFASQGFATLVVNYRGSLGYGFPFQTLNYQDLGNGDFKDIMSGVDYVVEQGIADPERLFIRGHSYGGFMSAFAIGQTNRFKAACVSAGISDWITHVSTTDGPIYMEALFGGAYWDNYPLWRKASPLSYVNNITTPTLILHGLGDDRVQFTQALQLHQVLKGRGIPTRLSLYFNERHSFSNPLANIDAMQETIRWFKEFGKIKIK